MTELTANCPRCNLKHTTFEVRHLNVTDPHTYQSECYAICRGCHKGSIFVVRPANNAFQVFYAIVEKQTDMPGNITEYVAIERAVSVRDHAGLLPPEHLPKALHKAFTEGTACLSINCPNAAASMFRLCIDLTTRSMMPTEDVEGLNSKVRRSLGLRMEWLFATNRLPSALQDLSQAIKDDGNDGAHEGTLTKADAEDLQDFTFALLERLHTEPMRLRLAKERRDARRRPAGAAGPG